IINRPPPLKNELFGLLKIRSADGKRQEISLKYSQRKSESHWQDIYETKASGGFPAQRLVVIHQAGQPNRYLVGSPNADGEYGDPVAVANEKASVPFAGTDFWLTDLGLEFFHWPDQNW